MGAVWLKVGVVWIFRARKHIFSPPNLQYLPTPRLACEAHVTLPESERLRLQRKTYLGTLSEGIEYTLNQYFSMVNCRCSWMGGQPEYMYLTCIHTWIHVRYMNTCTLHVPVTESCGHVIYVLPCSSVMAMVIPPFHGNSDSPNHKSESPNNKSDNVEANR